MRDVPAQSVPMGRKPYDMLAGGGTTTLEIVVDAHGKPHVTREWVSVSGTLVNCAGGVTPSGSWLTCEETTEGVAQGREKNHGYVFEVPAAADDEVTAVPLPAMGRFAHEAIAVDPRAGVVYETEDAGNTSGFYRFIPHDRRDLTRGGRLQMLGVAGKPRFDTRNQTAGQSGAIVPFSSLAAIWFDIPNPDPAVITGATSCFAQGFAAGGARFARLEGCWYGDRRIFFNATSGGRANAGQVFQYDLDSDELMLVFESPSADVLDAPDNICVSPRGGLVLCEDGGGTQFIRGLTRDGRIFDLVRSAGSSASEFAGACFSPDGGILFFNTQGSTTRLGDERGGTFGLVGPWELGAL
jgi:secreted PhoX family phosphatase